MCQTLTCANKDSEVFLCFTKGSNLAFNSACKPWFQVVVRRSLLHMNQSKHGETIIPQNILTTKCQTSLNFHFMHVPHPKNSRSENYSHLDLYVGLSVEVSLLCSIKCCNLNLGSCSKNMASSTSQVLWSTCRSLVFL